MTGAVVLVCGGRDFTDQGAVSAALDALCGSGTADMVKAAKLAGVPVWEPLKTEDATL